MGCRSIFERVAKTGRTRQLESPQLVKADYPSASIIGGDRVVFNIKGNNYRLVVHIDYRAHKVYVRFIGSHAEYDRIQATEV